MGFDFGEQICVWKRARAGLYADAVFRQIQKKFDLVFVKAIMVGMDERHEKYGNSVKLLEPNLKNSAGGLRDLHNLLWVYGRRTPNISPNHRF